MIVHKNSQILHLPRPKHQASMADGETSQPTLTSLVHIHLFEPENYKLLVGMFRCILDHQKAVVKHLLFLTVTSLKMVW